tara:strand:- start:506 stop:1468 length:963 start_codon:yes stop_codon:yes gene_type:complete
MKKTILLISSALLISMNISAQTATPAVKIFSNFNYDMSAEDGENAFKAFEVKRSYLGYSYNIDDRFSTKITFDVGSNSGGSEYTAFLKIASLKWKASDKLTLNMGMVGTKNFKFMEKAWGRRYIEKSAQDKYKWASSADAGVTADYKVSENIIIDAQVLNGEGYKKTQSANGLFRGGVGLTYMVSNNLKLRLHQDISPRATYTDSTESQNITTAAIAYSGDNYVVGAEKSLMQNSDNVVGAEEQDIISIYGSYKLNDDYTFFARYDDCKKTDKAGSYTIYGIERKMAKGVTIALNMQSWTDAAEGSEAEETLFLNLEYEF